MISKYIMIYFPKMVTILFFFEFNSIKQTFLPQTIPKTIGEQSQFKTFLIIISLFDIPCNYSPSLWPNKGCIMRLFKVYLKIERFVTNAVQPPLRFDHFEQWVFVILGGVNSSVSLPIIDEHFINIRFACIII